MMKPTAEPPVYLADGEWIVLRRQRDVLVCCDCRLAHRIEYRVTKGRVHMRFSRLNRMTAALRRWARYRALTP